ncbi:MAG: hypothetical protein MUE44_01455 [Oscillatoriaceae cyanobacterium Prado104]|nr:hypothetical protein [Oscillatoriaceae cyanobacterium Prado104]
MVKTNAQCPPHQKTYSASPSYCDRFGWPAVLMHRLVAKLTFEVSIITALVAENSESGKARSNRANSVERQSQQGR